MCDMTHSYVLEKTHSYVHQDPLICATWLIHMCHMTHPYVWHDSSICAWKDSLIRAPWPPHMCNMTHSYVWHDPFICVTWLIHMCLKRLTHMCTMTPSYVQHDSFICVTWPMLMCDSCQDILGGMECLRLNDTHVGWLRLAGSLKLQVPFAKQPYKRDYILQKRPIISRSLLIVATPYECLDLRLSHITMSLTSVTHRNVAQRNVSTQRHT